MVLNSPCHDLEGAEHVLCRRSTAIVNSTFVYEIYIGSTPERLWSALTDDTEFMKQYWFGVHCESAWTAGSPWSLLFRDGRVLDTGEILLIFP